MQRLLSQDKKLCIEAEISLSTTVYCTM